MPSVRYLKVSFKNELHPSEINKFRASIIEKTNREYSLYHNHKDDNKFHYRYPLIQYKINRKKASIVCLESGSDDIFHLLQKRDLQLRIGNRIESFEIDTLEMNSHQVKVWDIPLRYNIMRWIALNQKHIDIYLAHADNRDEQVRLLESILLGNILSFAKGINWFIKEKIKIKITNLQQCKTLPFKGLNVLTFTIDFVCNISLPDYIGLGKGVSKGYGVVRKYHMKPKEILQV